MRARLFPTVLAMTLALVALPATKAWACPPDDNRICDTRKKVPEPKPPAVPEPRRPSPTESHWFVTVFACDGNQPTEAIPHGRDLECPASRSCPTVGLGRYWVFMFTWDGANWRNPVRVRDACLDPSTFVGNNRTVSEQMVIAELRSKILPRLRLEVSPRPNLTLVGLESIFWAEAETLQGSLWFFGHTLRVQYSISPDQFRWFFGDGGIDLTKTPGRPYPSTDVTHTYEQNGDYSSRVDVTWGHLRFRPDGGAWERSNQVLVSRGIPVGVNARNLEVRLGRDD